MTATPLDLTRERNHMQLTNELTDIADSLRAPLHSTPRSLQDELLSPSRVSHRYGGGKDKLVVYESGRKQHR
jgi:hypothetical protein